VLGTRDIATVRIGDEEFLALARPLVPSNIKADLNVGRYDRREP